MRFFLPLRLFAFGVLSVFSPLVRAAERPALVVVISIDQFRADYLERFQAHFGAGGFRLLMDQGAYFTDCHYQHSITKTACGHSVMLTGVYANEHGIIGNDWIQRGTFERVSCVGDKTVEILGLPPGLPHLPGIDDPYLGKSPANLLATTLGDEWKIDRGGQPKVIGISNKDRAAILMSGKLANAAYFMIDGKMVSSTYYMKALPDWVQAWNAANKADAYFGKKWERLLPESAYALQGPDDADGENQTTLSLGNTLPKTVTGGVAAPAPKFYDALEDTPFSNELLADFARNAIEGEKLGQRAGITDLLCVSFSGNDHIGHMWGPNSHEIMDNVVRMDRTLAEFFQFLDRTVGLAKCTLVLTADHGVSPTPEAIHRLSPSIPAGRLNGAVIEQAVNQALVSSYGALADKSRWTLRDDASFLIFPDALKQKNLASAAVQATIRDALLQLDFVEAAYTRTQLERGEVVTELGRQAVLSFNRERSGDVFFQTKPYFFSMLTGAQHGSPYNYDTQVPLIFFGAGVKPGARTERVGVDDLAPTLARILGIPAPPRANGRVLF
jgi:predicted AlkP superfamily pyrophosphatase or phosphodiesterase